jgi:asparagine synthase (glutamine-hydrolysing)
MCGIAGIVSTEWGVATPTAVERMTRIIRHRGPDDSGIWHAGFDGGEVALGHRRLSIIDLSAAGHQPMTNEDGSMWLTYNGEIYNHAAVRPDLERAGHRYRSHTDSETILHAYEEYGDRCVERFRGMFAFAIWDGRRKRLLVARDRLGVKPVYYAQIGTTLVFASEIKAILESGLVKARPAAGALSEYLLFGYRASVETMFDGIRKLPPGHVLAWDGGRIDVTPYWSLRFAADTRSSRADLEAEFRSLFQESVRLRLMSDVPLGVFLSGGLDSSAIAAVMKPMVPDRIKTFSVGFESRYYSEFSYARQVAQLIGSDHHEIVLTARGFGRSLPALIWHEDEPLWGTASVALYFVSHLAAQHVKVVLTGEGSDETFAGYDRYWMTALNARILRFYRLAPAAVRAGIRKALVDGPLPERARRALSHTFVQYETMPKGLFFDNWFGVFTPEWQRAIAGPALAADIDAGDPYGPHTGIYERAGGDVVDRMLYTDIQASLVELLMKQDQMSMATSIESRVPFLDHKLVEFAARVPSRFKIGRSSGKQLVKSALTQELPESIRHRKKMGFPVPYDQWLRTDFAPDIKAVLLSDRARDRDWFQPRAIETLLADHFDGRANYGRQIWALWNLELWARACLDGIRPELPPMADLGVLDRSAEPALAR